MDCRVHKLVGDVTLVAGDQIALVRYRDVSRYDGQRGWFLPDDYLEHAEEPAACAVRIVREQLGLAVEPPRLANVESFANGAWHLIFHHVLEVEGLPRLTAGPNVLEAQWFDRDHLPARDELAHDGWAADVLDAVLSGRP